MKMVEFVSTQPEYEKYMRIRPCVSLHCDLHIHDYCEFIVLWEGEAFERSGDSLKGAVFADEKNKKKKKQDETKTPEEIELEKRLKEQRINEMTLIAEMWLKCLNGIDSND